MSESPQLTDPSCYHSSFAAVLRSVDPTADPVAALGRNAATSARLDDEGLLKFADPVEPLGESLRRSGYSLVRHPVGAAEDWREAEHALDEGRTIAVAADYFHLPHYWPGQGRIHALHVVALHSPDRDEGTVGIRDLGDVIHFDGEIPATDLRAAMHGSDLGQAWYELRAAGPFSYEPSQLAWQLTGPGSEWLSGTELVGALRDGLDDYLERVASRGRASTAGQSGWGLGQRLPLGLWWYHHTLRWFARHLRAETDSPVPYEHVELAADDVLAIRNLIMRLGAMGAANPRAGTFRKQLESRLADATANLEAAGARTGRSGATP
ncbi:hypothetical protein [Streptomyces sp. NPDC050392]|uniref:hypothetical protein n=1 Tax=Streptomyces sp. NPDC050392 TaxID=3155782 RepID=UPI00342459DF